MQDESAIEEQGGWFDQTWQAFDAAFKRFPLSVLCLVALIFHVLLNGQSLLTYAPGFEWQSFLAPYYEVPVSFRQYFWLLGSGFFGFTAVALATENKGWGFAKRYGPAIGFYAVYALYLQLEGISIGSTISAQTLCLGLAISVSFAPWLLRPGNNLAFWRFTRYCMGSFIKVSLLAVLAFFALFLFDVMGRNSVGGSIFFLRWPILIWLFGWVPITFLARIPGNIGNEQIQANSFTPSSFVWYLLAAGIIAIAFFYSSDTFKHYLATTTASEWLGLSVVLGLVLPLIANPLPTSNDLLRFFHRYLYLLLLIPVAYLAYVLKIRIDNYGLTEWRYFGLLICIWALICIGLFYFGKQPFQLQSIPHVLAALCILASFGMWQIGKLPVSLQFKELEKLLTANKWLSEGIYTQPTLKNQPSLEVRKKIADKVSFLAERGAAQKFRAWFADKALFDKVITCASSNTCRVVSSEAFDKRLLSYMHIMDPDAGADLSEINAIAAVSGESWADDAWVICRFFRNETGLNLVPDTKLAQYSDLEYEYRQPTGDLYAVEGYDFVIPYNFSEAMDGVLDIRKDEMSQPQARIRFKARNIDKLELTIGKPNLLNNDDPKIAGQSAQEKLKNFPLFSGRTRTISFDLQAYLDQMMAQYPKELELDSFIATGDINNIRSGVPLDKEVKIPFAVEKTENGLKAKFEMSELSVLVKVENNEKKAAGFNGRIYLKFLP